MENNIHRDNPLISVVIPVYNVEKYLDKCLQSVLSQGFDPKEIILVDDGSPDNCGTICDRYARDNPGTVRVIHQENKGLSGARNTGIEHSRGEYLLFVDSDDTLAPNALSIIGKGLERHGYPDMLVFNSRSEDENGNIVFGRIPASIEEYRAPVDEILNTRTTKELLLEYHGAWCRVTKKEVFVKNSIVFPHGLWYEDLGSTPMLLVRSPQIVYIPDILYIYLHRDGSIMSSTDTSRMCGDMIGIFEVILDWFRTNNVFEEYYAQLEYMTVDKLLLTQAVKIIQIGGPKEHVKRLVRFTAQEFPGFRKNRYLQSGSRKNRIKVNLLGLRWIGALRGVTKIYNRVARS